ncbi:MAG: response regulator [Methylobacterium mesophilicum]|nr:response regulator [Methylobacterium mesophilicum]
MARKVVLVVEDEPLLRMMAVDMVEEAGFEAVEAWDAEEAIRILEGRLDIRVVFTDIDMPNGVDGLKLAAAIRDRWPPIEIIITSGKLWSRGLKLPERAVFFPKPYQRDKVAAEMRRMVADVTN